METTPTYEANRPIPLGELQIEFVIDGRLVHAPAKAVQNLFPSPHIVLEVSSVTREPGPFKPVSGQPGVRSAPILSEGPSIITLKNGIKLDVVPSSWEPFQQDATLHLAHSPCVVLQTDTPMKFMQFAVLNFSWAGLEYPLILEASPWSVRIDPVPNIAALKRTLETDRGYATTHQGTVERLDGNLFPVEEATDLLYGLDDFLSFVCGSFCSLTNVIGIDSGGNEAWKRWGSHHVSPWRRHRSWLDITISGALPDIFSSFWCEYKKNKKSLSRVLKLYALSNKTGFVDVSVILTQAALELLSYLTVGKKKERKTGDWMADGLQKAGIDPQIPSDFGELEKLRQREECKHGPHTIVKMRNSMTHSEFLIGDISIDVYYQAMNLGLWYLELLLLRMFEHTGKYASRLTPVQRAGYTELVPWAQGGGV